MEAFVALNLFLTSFKVTGDGAEVEASSGVSSRPADGVRVTIEYVAK